MRIKITTIFENLVPHNLGYEIFQKKHLVQTMDLWFGAVSEKLPEIKLVPSVLAYSEYPTATSNYMCILFLLV